MIRRTFFLSLACLALLLMAACAQPTQMTVPTAASTAEASESTTAPSPTEAQSNKRSVSSSEFGLSLAYDPTLAQEAIIQAVEPVPLSPQIMFAEAHPGYIKVTFPGYALTQVSQLPYPISEPQVMIFRTADFGMYSSGNWNDFPSQQKALESLLADGVSADRCARLPESSEAFLPYLPWTNAAQVFCGQVKELPFGSGKGIRYLTSYSQGISPVIDPFVFYTFQGLTNDGQYYVSAVFPVDTTVFPDEMPQGDVLDPLALQRTLTNQLTTLNAQPAGAFLPSLDLLDEVLQSIQVQE